MAGALNVQLGGPSTYGGRIAETSVADMAPPGRRSCQRLSSRVTILCGACVAVMMVLSFALNQIVWTQLSCAAAVVELISLYVGAGFPADGWLPRRLP